MRDGTAIVIIKIAKVQGAESISFLSESFRPGDALPFTNIHTRTNLFFYIKAPVFLHLVTNNTRLRREQLLLYQKESGMDCKIMAVKKLKCALVIRLQDSKAFSEK